MSTPQGYEFVKKYIYRREDGGYFFEKHRFARIGDDPSKRPKEFRYYNADTGDFRKPSGADEVVYRLPELLAGIRAGKIIHWPEGEKDCDALVAAGEVATSSHQGACKLTLAQARWLRGAHKVVLWVDKDRGHWEVGAYDAVLRHNMLVEAGVPEESIRFVRAQGAGKDAADHLKRYTVDAAVPVEKIQLAKVASAYTTSSRQFAGYRRG